MAREWTDILAECIAHYPTALGDAGQDNTLQLSLIKFANSLFNRIDRERRWSLSYFQTSITTTPNVSQYAMPTGMTAISHMYWIKDAGGTPVTLDSYDIQELRRIFGDGTNAQPGPPRYWAIIGNTVQVFPTPDNAGPASTGGNYQIFFEGYLNLTPIVQTTGTTVAGVTLTVPSTAYLTARGVATTGTALSVMGAGNLGPGSVPDVHYTGWSAFPLATTVTMTTPAITVNATPVKVYFNSSNWVIQNFDHVVLFGVLREVAAYLKENFQIWDQRFEMAMENMAQADVDRRKDLESQAVSMTAQEMPELAGRARSIWGTSFWGY